MTRSVSFVSPTNVICLGLDLAMLEWLTGVDVAGVVQARPPADSCFQSVIIQLRRSDSAVRDEKSVS